MKTKMALILACLLILLSSVAFACGPYVLIPDSDERLLTERELRAYSYDALGYALNEIVARHGYHFDPDGKYYSHFSDICEYNEYTEMFEYFYEEAPQSVTNDMIYRSLSRTEMKNMTLIKKVREDMKARGAYTGEDHDLWMCNGEW